MSLFPLGAPSSLYADAVGTPAERLQHVAAMLRRHREEGTDLKSKLLRFDYVEGLLDLPEFANAGEPEVFCLLQEGEK